MTMTPRFRLSFSVLLCGFLAASAAISAGAHAGREWVSLFNGRDLSGWVVMHDPAFSVAEGLLHVEKGSGWLRSEKEYGDFILEVEWRALEPKYNSGIFVRAAIDGKPFPPDAWQVNLKESAVGELLRGSTNRVPSVTPPQPVGQWVKYRIEARGRTLTLDVDGRRAWVFGELEPARGYIGVQSEGRSFDFRNLRIQELP